MSLRWNRGRIFDVIQITMRFPTSFARKGGWTFPLACGLALALSASAVAEVPPAVQAQYQRGSDSYRKGRFDAAVREFGSAYEMYPSPRLLYDVAQAERKLGQVEAALRHYEVFLKMEKAITPLTRGIVQGYVNRLKATPLGRKPPNPPRNLPDLFDPTLAPHPGGATAAAPPARVQAPPPAVVPPPAVAVAPPPPVKAPPPPVVTPPPAAAPPVAVAVAPVPAPVAPPAPAPVVAGPTPSYGIMRLAPAQTAPPAVAQAPLAPAAVAQAPVAAGKPLSGRWVPVPVKPGFTLRDTFAQGDALFAVGDGGVFYVALQDGVFRGVRSGVNNWLGAVWGTGNELFMAGDSGLVLRRFGGRMKPVPTGTTRTLFAVGGTSSEWFAVGEGGTAVRWNGNAFVPVPTGTRQPLFAVLGLDNQVFVVGGGGLILQWNGGAFVPMESGTSHWLHGLWGTSRGDVYAVGAHGTILHYDGRSWTPQPSGTQETLLGIWGSASNRAVVVGSRGTILHRQPDGWHAAKSGTQASLFGVYGHSPDSVYAVGDGGTVLRLQPE